MCYSQGQDSEERKAALPSLDATPAKIAQALLPRQPKVEKSTEPNSSTANSDSSAERLRTY